MTDAERQKPQKNKQTNESDLGRKNKSSQFLKLLVWKVKVILVCLPFHHTGLLIWASIFRKSFTAYNWKPCFPT